MTFRLFTNYEYKRDFLRSIPPQYLYNNHNLQLYRIQDYLRDILIPVIPYRITFNFLFFVTQGHIHQQVDNTVCQVTAGHCLTVYQGTVTSTVAISPDAEGFVAVYEEEVVTNFLRAQGQRIQFNASTLINLDPYDIQALLAHCILLEEELKHRQHQPLVSLHLFYALLSRITYNTMDTASGLRRDLNIFSRFKQLVQAHHVQHKSVGFYAQQLSISENYLNKCVKRATGKSTKQWINETNILYSKILLQDPQLDVSQIAYNLNFQSPSYYARLFKKITGKTPSEYRKV